MMRIKKAHEAVFKARKHYESIVNETVHKEGWIDGIIEGLKDAERIIAKYESLVSLDSPEERRRGR